MDSQKDLFDILFYLAAPALVLATAYFLITKFFEREQRLQLFELKRSVQQNTLPLRLQAYERVLLYLERIMLNNLVARVNDSDMNVRQLQMSMIHTIRDEYDHNITQQLYMSSASWLLVKKTKEETITIIINTAETLDPNLPSANLAKALFEYIINNDFIGTQEAMDIIKDEARQLF